MKYLLSAMMDAVLPRVCAVCGHSLVRGETALCMHCLMDVPRTRMHLHPDNSIVARLASPSLRLELAAAWMEYNRHSPYAAIVRDAKYRSMPRLARECAAIFAREMQADGCAALADIDVLLPVPMHWAKQLRRGYNQSCEVARGISAVAGIPVGDNLRAVRRHVTQTRRSAEERRSNVRGIMALRHAGELQGLHVAVVDDVITTGATMAEALRALSAAKPRSISVLSLAAVHADEWGNFRD